MILPTGVTLPIYGSLAGSSEGYREGEATIKGESSKGKDAGSVAQQGLSGGILGAIIGGGKGAAIGGGVGGGAGLAGVLLSRGQELELPRGTTLEFVLDQDLEF
jgi:hypothetical protein